MKTMIWDEPGRQFDAWCAGRTGYPIVDAGMRQLLGQGWMHNRVRMIVASFLVKDLHIDWPHGARHFMRSLVDGDLASNQHGWQWTAPGVSVPTPRRTTASSTRSGKARSSTRMVTYVRRWVPELRDVVGRGIHEPWLLDSPPEELPGSDR